MRTQVHIWSTVFAVASATTWTKPSPVAENLADGFPRSLVAPTWCLEPTPHVAHQVATVGTRMITDAEGRHLPTRHTDVVVSTVHRLVLASFALNSSCTC